MSGAARGLCMWVRAICVYGGVSRDIAPRRARLASAQKALAAKQAALTDAQAMLVGTLAAVATLRVCLICLHVHSTHSVDSSALLSISRAKTEELISIAA